MKWFLVGLGLSVGAGIVYALYVNEAARLLVVFLLGAVLFGAAILVTAVLVNRQWIRGVEASRITHNHRYAPPVVQGVAGRVESPEMGLLPPMVSSFDVSEVGRVGVDDEVVA